MTIFSKALNAFRTGTSAENIPSVIKNLPVDDFDVPTLKPIISKSISKDAFQEIGGKLFFKDGTSVVSGDFIWRAGDIQGVFRKLSIDTNQLDNNIVTTFRRVTNDKYPQSDIANNLNSIIDDTPNLNRLPDVDKNIIRDLDGGINLDAAFKTIDQRSLLPDNFWSNMWTVAKRGGKIAVIGGTITVGALLLSDIIKSVHAINSGCMLATKLTNTTQVQRILRYTCGERGIEGDNVYLQAGNTPAEHPAKDIISNACRNDEPNGCETYCDPETVSDEIQEVFESMSPSLYVMCKDSSYSETIVGIGIGIGTGVGGLINGAFEGFFGSFGIWLIIILIVFAVIIGGVFLLRIIPKNKTS